MISPQTGRTCTTGDATSRKHTQRDIANHTQDKTKNAQRIPSHIALTNISHPQCVAVQPTSESNQESN